MLGARKAEGRGERGLGGAVKGQRVELALIETAVKNARCSLACNRAGGG